MANVLRQILRIELPVGGARQDTPEGSHFSTASEREMAEGHPAGLRHHFSIGRHTLEPDLPSSDFLKLLFTRLRLPMKNPQTRRRWPRAAFQSGVLASSLICSGCLGPCDDPGRVNLVRYETELEPSGPSEYPALRVEARLVDGPNLPKDFLRGTVWLEPPFGATHATDLWLEVEDLDTGLVEYRHYADFISSSLSVELYRYCDEGVDCETLRFSVKVYSEGLEPVELTIFSAAGYDVCSGSAGGEWEMSVEEVP